MADTLSFLKCWTGVYFLFGWVKLLRRKPIKKETTMRNFTFLVFVVMTFCCWGIYGPVLHVGQEQMAGGEGKASLRPFMCVGIAYFLIAVVYPLWVLYTKGEQGNWTTTGFIWSFAAGVITAIGALGIVLAFKFQGKPVYVMPLVFGLAPIVNTFVTMFMSGTFKQASLKFFVGIIIVAIGAAGVLTYQPKNTAKPKSKASVNQNSNLTLVAFPAEGNQAEEDQAESTPEKTKPETESNAEIIKDKVGDKTSKPTKFNGLAVAICIAVTVVCWGSYGPLLHRGQIQMSGSKLRPLLCVGLAYFAVAVIGPLLLLGTFEEPGGWSNTSGVIWSLVAGAAGALGSLGIIYAFNFGGKPVFVMPLIFGFAPVINTLTETISKNLLGQVSTEFIISLLMVIVGAAMVLIFAPRGKKPKPANEPAIT
jgi:uncharacterized protein (UPF0333 family)